MDRLTWSSREEFKKMCKKNIITYLGSLPKRITWSTNVLCTLSLNKKHFVGNKLNQKTKCIMLLPTYNWGTRTCLQVRWNYQVFSQHYLVRIKYTTRYVDGLSRIINKQPTLLKYIIAHSQSRRVPIDKQLMCPRESRLYFFII